MVGPILDVVLHPDIQQLRFGFILQDDGEAELNRAAAELNRAASARISIGPSEGR